MKTPDKGMIGANGKPIPRSKFGLNTRVKGKKPAKLSAGKHSARKQATGGLTEGVLRAMAPKGC